MRSYTVSIDIRVLDEETLFKTALKHATSVDFMPEDQAIEQLKPEGEIDVSACLTMILDPGLSPAGTEINGTDVESYYASR
jgi:hypothetical protein